MERQEDGHSVPYRSLKRHAELLNMDPDALPCFCTLPHVTVMKRGTYELEAIYWTECVLCGRQWLPGWNHKTALLKYVASLKKKEDPYNEELERPRHQRHPLLPVPCRGSK